MEYWLNRVRIRRPVVLFLSSRGSIQDTAEETNVEMSKTILKEKFQS